MQEIYKDQTPGAVVALTTVVYLNTSVGKTQLRSLHRAIFFSVQFLTR